MTDSTPAPALWRQLQATATALAAVRAGRSLTPALQEVPAALRPGVQALAFACLRQLGRAEALRRQLARKAPAPAVDALLCVSLALASDAAAPYEAHTLVDQAVEAAKRQPATRNQASFVNACLRRYLREREALHAGIATDPVAVWNHPLWWIRRLQQDHPDHWQQILHANNARAPLVLRVNGRRVSREQYQQALQADGLQALAVGAQGLQLAQATAVPQLPGYREGWFSVQDAGAQQAAPLLLGGLQAPADRPLRVLDACAAPGGKTAHVLELVDGTVTALDIDAERCARIHDNLARLGLRAQVLVADAAAVQTWWPVHCDSQPFDAILLDAPCTASGIVRRHPDVRWLRRESDIAQLAAQQARLLAALWPLLRPGGRMLYCTCSVFRAEGDAQIQTFLARHTDAALQASPGHLLPQTGASDPKLPDNPQCDHDGFYYALLEKHSR